MRSTALTTSTATITRERRAEVRSRLKQLAKQILRLGDVDAEAFEQYRKYSWSQSGEDLIIEYLFRAREIAKPTYLDIGAYHPAAANNTYKFYQKGARGVNVDANPLAIERFAHARPADTNINAAVGAKAGRLEFYVMEDDSLNTLSRDEVEKLERLGQRLNKSITVDVVAVNSILQSHFPSAAPDLVSIDAEGVDLEIILSYDFNRFAPKVLCVETIEYTPDGTGAKRAELCGAIEQRGYFEYANTNINSIYVNRAWWFEGNEGRS